MPTQNNNWSALGCQPHESVQHKGQHFAGLVRRWDTQLNTYRYSSRRKLRSDGHAPFLPLLHGMGPVSSSAGSMLSLLNVLTESKKKRGRSKSLKLLQALDHYRVYNAEAIDLPGCHTLPESSVQDLAGMCEWAYSWLESAKEHCQSSLIPIARCASAAIIVEINRRYPKLFCGMVLLSPMLPADAAHSNGDLLQRVSVGECALNEAAFALMNGMNEESKWDRLSDPFGASPTLILFGSRDPQTSDAARDRIRHWSTVLPHVRAYQLATGHDVMNLREGSESVRAYDKLYEFLRNVPPGQS